MKAIHSEMVEEARRCLEQGQAYGLLTRLGKQYGCSRERVRQILNKHLPKHLLAVGICPVCGREFTRAKLDQKYCSLRCRYRSSPIGLYVPLVSPQKITEKLKRVYLKSRCGKMREEDWRTLEALRDALNELLRNAGRL